MMRTLVLRVVAIVITLALLWWVVADGRWQGVAARLARIDASALVGVALLFAASYAMRGARIYGEFRDELGAEGSATRRYLRILRLTLVHNALVNVMPFRSGEVAFPVLLTRWFGIATGRAVVALLWLRAQDACVVFVLAALVWPDVPIAWRLAALSIIIGGAWALPVWARRHRFDRGRGAANDGKVAKLRLLLARSTRSNASGWMWTLANWSVKLVAEAWLLALALGPRTGAVGAAAAHQAGSAALGAIGAELAAILPVQGIAGFGTFEAGAAALMATQGVAMTSGLEAALVLHAVVLVLALVAGGLGAMLLPGPGGRN